MLLQVDIRFANAGTAYAQAVADGQLDEAIDGLCFGLQQLGRPVFLRLAPEANSSWNDYDPEAYKTAWRRVAQTLRDRWQLRNIALVWSIAADGYADYMTFYPGMPT